MQAHADGDTYSLGEDVVVHAEWLAIEDVERLGGGPVVIGLGLPLAVPLALLAAVAGDESGAEKGQEAKEGNTLLSALLLLGPRRLAVVVLVLGGLVVGAEGGTLLVRVTEASLGVLVQNRHVLFLAGSGEAEEVQLDLLPVGAEAQGRVVGQRGASAHGCG